MKDAILIELAHRWEQDSIPYDGPMDGSPNGEMNNARKQGEQETLRMCANTLRSLVSLIGESPNNTPPVNLYTRNCK